MEGLNISEVPLSKLEYSGRLDAEYYQPHYLEYEEKIKEKSVPLSSISNFLIGPFGSAFTVDNYTEDKSYRYIRGKDVKPLKLMDNDNVYMPEEDYKRLSRYALKENDILVSVVGTLGNAALVTKKDLPAIFSCKSTVLRPLTVNEKYLLVYLNTKYGRELLLRKERGAIQKGLNLDDLKTLDVFIPSENFQLLIDNIYSSSIGMLNKSNKVYDLADTHLLDVLELTDFNPSTSSINTKSFKESFLTSGRLDSEYYQPKFEQILKHITSKNHSKLKNLVEIKKSIEPGSSNYAEDGLPFLRVSDYSTFGINEVEKRLSAEFVSENKNKIEKLKPKKDTILFSKDGTVGIAYMLREDMDLVTSSAILHLHVKDKQKLVPEYLTLLLNSKVVQMQAERDAGGSIILHWRVNEIEDVNIPLVDYEKQVVIADLVKESFKLRTQSDVLFEAAQRAVEIAIEENEASAIKFINENIKGVE